LSWRFVFCFGFVFLFFFVASYFFFFPVVSISHRRGKSAAEYRHQIRLTIFRNWCPARYRGWTDLAVINGSFFDRCGDWFAVSRDRSARSGVIRPDLAGGWAYRTGAGLGLAFVYVVVCWHADVDSGKSRWLIDSRSIPDGRAHVILWRRYRQTVVIDKCAARPECQHAISEIKLKMRITRRLRDGWQAHTVLRMIASAQCVGLR